MSCEVEAPGGGWQHWVPLGWRLLIRRVAAGKPRTEVARQMRLSRACRQVVAALVGHGEPGLGARSSRPTDEAGLLRPRLRLDRAALYNRSGTFQAPSRSGDQ